MAINNSTKNKVELARQWLSAQAYANNHHHDDDDDNDNESPSSALVLGIILELCITEAERKSCYAKKKFAICKFLHKAFDFLLQSSWQKTLVEAFVDSLCALAERKALESPEVNMILAEIYAEILQENIAAAAVGGETFSLHNLLLKPLSVLLAHPSISLCFSFPKLHPDGLAVSKSVFSLLLSCPDSALQQNLVLVRSLVGSFFYLSEEEENVDDISQMCHNECVKDMHHDSVSIGDIENTEEEDSEKEVDFSMLRLKESVISETDAKEVDSGKELNLKGSVIMEEKQNYDPEKEEWGDDSVVVDPEEPFKIAATTSITNPRSRSSPIASSNGSSSRKRMMTMMNQENRLRFALEQNVVWWPGTPLPPENVRLPPSVTPRGSALKKGVPAGPVRPCYFTKNNIIRSPQKQPNNKKKKIYNNRITNRKRYQQQQQDDRIWKGSSCILPCSSGLS